MSTEKLPSTISIQWDSEYSKSGPMSLTMRHMCSATCTINEQHKRSLGVHRSFITSKVIILGDVGVGKTKLTEKFCIGKDLSDSSERTVRAPNAIYEKIISKSSLSVHLKIFDTAGQERYRSITSSHYRGAQGCLLVFDVTNEDSFQSISSWHDDLNTYCDATDIPILLVGTIPKIAEHTLKNPPKVKLDEADEDVNSSSGRKPSTDSVGERSDTYERSSSRMNSYTGLRKISTEKAGSYAEHLDIPYVEVEMEDQSQIYDVFEKLVDCIADKAKNRYNLFATNTNKILSSEELWKQYCKKVTSYKCSC